MQQKKLEKVGHALIVRGDFFLTLQHYLKALLSIDLDLNAYDLKRLDLLGIKKGLGMKYVKVSVTKN